MTGHSGQQSTSANAAWTVQEKMEIVTGLYMHGEVGAHEGTHRTGIPCTTV